MYLNSTLNDPPYIEATCVGCDLETIYQCEIGKCEHLACDKCAGECANCEKRACPTCLTGFESGMCGKCW